MIVEKKMISYLFDGFDRKDLSLDIRFDCVLSREADCSRVMTDAKRKPKYVVTIGDHPKPR